MTVITSRRKIIIFGIIFIFIVSSLIHSLYDWTGKPLIIGLIAPINESLWEHLKMPIIPTVLWWIIAYYLFLNKKEADLTKWILCGMISFIITILVTGTFYYIYTGALGIHSMIFDVLSLLLGIILGVTKAIDIYYGKNPSPFSYYLVYFIFFAFMFMFIVFTFKAPDLPLFQVHNDS